MVSPGPGRRARLRRDAQGILVTEATGGEIAVPDPTPRAAFVHARLGLWRHPSRSLKARSAFDLRANGADLVISISANQGSQHRQHPDTILRAYGLLRKKTPSTSRTHAVFRSAGPRDGAWVTPTPPAHRAQTTRRRRQHYFCGGGRLAHARNPSRRSGKHDGVHYRLQRRTPGRSGGTRAIAVHHRRPRDETSRTAPACACVLCKPCAPRTSTRLMMPRLCGDCYKLQRVAPREVST